ncbi:MAG: phosphotransferase, partial [Caulobacteraceae bacterium]
MSAEREAVRLAFLRANGLAGAVREPLAGDASTRRYERLRPAAGASLILMDQPPSAESPPCPPAATPDERAALGFNALYRLAAGRVDAFVACAGWLRGLGLSAPEVIAADPAAGLAVLEDLGDDVYGRLIGAGVDEVPLYEAAVDVLLRLHAVAPPVIVGAWPLLAYDDLALKTAGDLFLEWAPKFYPGLAFDDGAFDEWESVWRPIRRRAEVGASVFCLRDFHAENLIWLPDRIGVARVGLLDFQDAVVAHPAWDLSMLLHDARRQVTPGREAAVLAR